jgi:hypothetical protein
MGTEVSSYNRCKQPIIQRNDTIFQMRGILLIKLSRPEKAGQKNSVPLFGTTLGVIEALPSIREYGDNALRLF